MFEKIEDVPSKLLEYYYETVEVNKVFDEEGNPVMTTVPIEVVDEEGNTVTIQRPVQVTEEIREVIQHDKGTIMTPETWWGMAKDRKGETDDLLKLAITHVNNFHKWEYHDNYLEWMEVLKVVNAKIDAANEIKDPLVRDPILANLQLELDSLNLKEPVRRGEITPEQWFITFATELRTIVESNYDFLVLSTEDSINHTTQVLDIRSKITLEYPSQEMLDDKNLVLNHRMEDLKRLRNNALSKGFTFKGNSITADRDAQGDVHRIYDQYKNGIKEPTDPTVYKVSPNVYITFVGQDEILDLLKAMTQFVEIECFGKEAVAAQQLVSMEVEELLTLDLSTIFQPDHLTDMSA